jgi:hypothetical protein
MEEFVNQTIVVPTWKENFDAEASRCRQIGLGITFLTKGVMIEDEEEEEEY